ncbi:DUF4785 domain-containing protein [Legionella longbeachae]|uniref:DUF4785 domain-containing protein n=1 Tax=Legionella longbeachae serogroup 1 (strain NSW150) TaxID=661367 RepID=D3HIT8_LEGLN|nr:DUF4785 domain-containing protein [Legionella longbeachae]VEE02827.1 Uncharacterised protein [Legionella oakridgensis]HBD7398003.1 DUF4785 family protein [Legionella pneumophila]ARB90929.1 DUF4785 domain-containing protein [Legionella longbeachae]ARM32640.1 DUF4785 family protein [Legionella longbeachae]EEZ94585.1 conserved hypothetical protein [Legionella longbeachae D-4968]
MKTKLILLSLLYCVQLNAYNLPQHPIKSYDCETCANLSHENLKDSWQTTEAPLKAPSSNAQKSYSYIKKVTAAQLEQGVTLPIHAPGAVMRIIPLEDKAIPALELKSASNPFVSLKDASSLYSQDEAIDESLKMGAHQTMLQIKPELGMGNFIIKSKTTKSPNESSAYLIHVFEKYSLIYLQIEPAALQYQYGDQFNATITLKDNETSYPIDDINATLIGPNNQAISLKLKEIKRNQYEASAHLLSDINTRGDNWYIEVDVTSELEDNSPTHRTGRAAFSYSIPSAGLVSIKKTSSKPLTFAVTADIATASRYALQSVLYKKNAAGENIPVETAQSALWLEPGRQIIHFSFDNSAQLAEDLLSVGYLHLTDYGQLKPVYQHDLPIKLSQVLD